MEEFEELWGLGSFLSIFRTLLEMLLTMLTCNYLHYRRTWPMYIGHHICSARGKKPSYHVAILSIMSQFSPKFVPVRTRKQKGPGPYHQGAPCSTRARRVKPM
jgi:hypothetical protein